MSRATTDVCWNMPTTRDSLHHSHEPGAVRVSEGKYGARTVFGVNCASIYKVLTTGDSPIMELCISLGNFVTAHGEFLLNLAPQSHRADRVHEPSPRH